MTVQCMRAKRRVKCHLLPLQATLISTCGNSDTRFTPGSDGSRCPEGRTVSPSGSVEVPCHQLAFLSAVPVQAPLWSGPLSRLPNKLKDYELH